MEGCWLIASGEVCTEGLLRGGEVIKRMLEGANVRSVRLMEACEEW